MADNLKAGEPQQPRAGYQYIDKRRCRGCVATVYWWRTPSGKASPHDIDGTSHFATCPNADQFRRPKKEPTDD